MSYNSLLPSALVLFLGLMTIHHATAETGNGLQNPSLIGTTSSRQSCQGEKERCRRSPCCDGLECKTSQPQRNRCFPENSACDLTYNTNSACSCYNYWSFNTVEPGSLLVLKSNTSTCLFSAPVVTSTSVQVGVPICRSTCPDDAEGNKRSLEGILEVFGEAESGDDFGDCVITNIKKIYPYTDGNVPECRDVTNIYKNVEPITKLILNPSAEAISALQACGVKTSSGSPEFKVQLSNINDFTTDRFALC